MQAEVSAKIAANTPPPKKIIIDEVTFEEPNRLPKSFQDQVTSEMKQSENDDDDTGWLDEIQDEIRLDLADGGFFKAQPTVNAKILRTDATSEHVALYVHVIYDQQYRLGTVQFRSSDPAVPLVFPIDQLRATLPLREGDIFAAVKIRAALDSLQRLYGSFGYIDLVATPEMDFDDDPRRVSLIMELDQGPQFHVDKVEILGLDPATRANLKSQIKSGDVFNADAIRGFIDANKAVLPADASFEDVELHRHVRNATVDVQFDFRTCPQ